MRDDFSAGIIMTLAKRVAYLCSNPLCRHATIGPGSERSTTVSIGVAAHITAASPAGPRFDSSLTREERSDIENGIWLCQSCSTLIDRDETSYAISTLKSWKMVAESDAGRELQGYSGAPRWNIDPFNSVDIADAGEPEPPYAFYEGFPVRYRDIAAGLDVLRTQYARAWKDEVGSARESWRDEVFRRSDRATHVKPRLVLFCGHRGSGRRTVLRRMAWDLRQHGTPCVDLLDEDILGLNSRDIADLARARADRVPHVLVSIVTSRFENDGPSLVRIMREIAYRKLPVVIWLRTDLRAREMFERDFVETLHSIGFAVEFQYLRPFLDKAEVARLVEILERHGRLGALAKRTPSARLRAFATRASRSLISVLFETTQAPDGGNFSDMVRAEYLEFPPEAQHLYLLVAMCSGRGVGIPLSLIERMSRRQAFRSAVARHLFDGTSGALRVTSAGTVFARNDLTAELLLQRLHGPQEERLKQSLAAESLSSLDLQDPAHGRFFDLLIKDQVLRAVENLVPLAKRIADQEFSGVRGQNASRVLNSIVRILQSRSNYDAGLLVARRSIALWKHVGNQAYFLKGFCEYYLGRRDDARRTADRLVQATGYPYHVLHGAILLKLLHEWEACRRVLEKFASEQARHLDEFSDYRRLSREVDLWLHVTCSASGEPANKPSVLLDRVEMLSMNDEVTDDVVFDEYQKILRRQHDFVRAYSSMFRWLNSPVPLADEANRLRRYRWLADECAFHLMEVDQHKRSYPREIVSLLHANRGRALFRQEYIAQNGVTADRSYERHFRRALQINPDNSYAHNWLGTYLKNTSRARDTARIEYQSAINLEPNNPVFRHNMALLLFEAPTFCKADLELAFRLAVQSQNICEAEERWRVFRRRPSTLSLLIAHVLENADLSDGDQLFRSDLIESDF